MTQQKTNNSKLVGLHFRIDPDLSIKIKLAALSEGITQKALINRVFRLYFEANPIDLSKFPDIA